ncbi:MAG: nuclear transport factor 2 family protein [Bacteroidetes bacterium]|nr:nuclear transport factor 2 family protein [Bacteroidota bacterium]
MKNISIFLTISLCLIFSCQVQETSKTETTTTASIDYEKEKAAIMELINEESAAFWDKDYERFAACWVHGPHVRTMGWWEDGGVTVVEGWEERSRRTQEHMAASPEPNPTANNVIRKNVNIRIYRDVAWLTFDQYGEDTGDQTMDMPGLSRETRILEKEDGKWKIAYVGWLLEGESGVN